MCQGFPGCGRAKLLSRVFAALIEPRTMKAAHHHLGFLINCTDV